MFFIHYVIDDFVNEPLFIVIVDEVIFKHN